MSRSTTGQDAPADPPGSEAAAPRPPIALTLADPLIAPLIPPPLRPAVLTLWALDRRLATIARTGREPALRQIRLRWWSETLASLDAARPPVGEPLLAEVAATLLPHIVPAELAALADAWEAEALDEPDEPAARGALLFTLTARLLGRAGGDVTAAGRLWARTDRALAAGDAAHWPSERVAAAGLPRPLAALTALAGSVARARGARRPLAEQLLLLRVGIIGR